MSDSLMIEATGYSEDLLFDLLRFCPISKVSGTSILNSTLVLHEYKESSAFPLPASMLPQKCVPIIMAWLSQKDLDYGREPNIDGDCKRGWKLTSSRLNHNIQIAPHWMIFHK